MIPPMDLHEKCDYCGSKLDAKSPRKRFCNDVCRIYFKRKNVDKNYSQKKKNSEPEKKLIFHNIPKKILDTKEPELSLKIKCEPNPISFDIEKVSILTHDEPIQYPDIPINEPKEGSMGFMRKYGVMTYEELKNKKDENI